MTNRTNRGMFFSLLVLEVCSHKSVEHEVHEAKSFKRIPQLIEQAVARGGISDSWHYLKP